MNHQTRKQVIEVCSILAQKEDLKVTVHESAKGALVAGMGVFIGGILAGPLGMAVGGTLTSVAVAFSSKGKFKSVVEIIAEMNDDQRNRLCEAIVRAVQSIRPEDYMGALTLVLTTGGPVKDVVLKEIGSFLYKEFHANMLQ